MRGGNSFGNSRIRPPAIFAMVLLLALVQVARAGGPAYVAGVSYFDPATKGTPLTWQQGQVRYYTDQGDLSTLLPQAAADAFVADAFSRWTSVPTAALQATLGGHLGEDVSGQNVIANPDGTISMPSDLLPSAVGNPLGIVYDTDGKVTDALLGTGAGGSSLCFTNSVYGGIDNFGTDAHFLHAVVIMNGNCAQTSAQLNDMKYRLVRMLGRTLGLGWSQVNANVFTRVPPWTQQDLSGLSIMHAVDPISCVPVAICYPSADQPRTDDRAAISRLYPVTAQNVSGFPGKQIFSDNTARIHGTVYFTDGSGLPSQGMQG